MEKFAAVQEQIEAKAKRKRQTEHVSKTLVHEMKWDKPIVSSEADRNQEPKRHQFVNKKPDHTVIEWIEELAVFPYTVCSEIMYFVERN